jgi:ATP-dependent helicase/nuclease subunit B
VSEDGHTVAYDYKTSRGPGVADMEAGRDLQLGIYLMAVEELFAREGTVVAGGGYYALKPVATRRNNGLYRADMRDYTDIGVKCRSSLDPDRWLALRRQIRENLWDAYDRIRTGDYRVAPSQDETTCSYCDFPKVCRFDRHRIQVKRRAERSAGRGAPRDL